MSSESKSFSKPDQEFTQFNNAHMAHVNVGGQRVKNNIKARVEMVQ